MSFETANNAEKAKSKNKGKHGKSDVINYYNNSFNSNIINIKTLNKDFNINISNKSEISLHSKEAKK